MSSLCLIHKTVVIITFFINFIVIVNAVVITLLLSLKSLSGTGNLIAMCDVWDDVTTYIVRKLSSLPYHYDNQSAV